jgi:gluconokinase
VTSQQPVVIGVDVGTSAVKAVAFATTGGRRASATCRVATRHPEPGRAEQDAAELRSAVLGALAECVAALRSTPVAAISLSTAMHGLAGLDADGAPCTPVLTWADGRAEAIVAAWRARDDADALQAHTGVPLHPMTPMAKLAWYATVDPKSAATVHRWVDVKALVVGWLTGAPATELSSASGWGLVDLATQTWSPTALALAEVDVAALPTIGSPTDSRPLTSAAAEEIGLPGGLPVVLGAGDGPLGNVGVGALEPGVVGLSLGTSGALRMVFDHVPPGGDRSLFCYSLTECSWVSGGAVSNGGDITGWVASALAPDWSELAIGTPARRLTDAPRRAEESALDLASSAPPGSDGLVMIPYLLPERAPLWDAELSGAYLGLRRRHTRADLARAAVEGVCLGMRAVLERLDAVHPVREVRATGGALAAPLWRDVLAASLGVPMVVVSAAEGSALGAAAMALVALGESKTLAEAVAGLAEPGAAAPRPVAIVPELAEAAEATRASIVGLAASVERSARALAPK